METKTYIFDIDKTIFNQKEEEIHKYTTDNIVPIQEMIDEINKLYEEGNTIIIMTGRGAITGIDWKQETEEQLKIWNVKYHELRFINKPLNYLYVDDKCCSPKEFLEMRKCDKLNESKKP